MSQVSRKPLDDKVFTKIFEIFIASMISINKNDRAEKFLSELLSETERIMLAKRIAIAFMLIKNYTYDEIRRVLKVSQATIWPINYYVKKKKCGYREVLEGIVKDDASRKSFDRLFSLIDLCLPPPYGTNWKTVRREQYTKERELQEPF